MNDQENAEHRAVCDVANVHLSLYRHLEKLSVTCGARVKSPCLVASVTVMAREGQSLQGCCPPWRGEGQQHSHNRQNSSLRGGEEGTAYTSYDFDLE